MDWFTKYYKGDINYTNRQTNIRKNTKPRNHNKTNTSKNTDTTMQYRPKTWWRILANDKNRRNIRPKKQRTKI